MEGVLIQSVLTPLAIAAFLALVAERLVAGLVTPLFDKFKWDKFYLLYVGWVVASAIVFISNANIFQEYIPDEFIGHLLTAIVAGGGSNLIHDIFDR